MSATSALPACPICSAPGKRIPYDGLRIFGAQCTACGWFYSRKRRSTRTERVTEGAK